MKKGDFILIAAVFTIFAGIMAMKGTPQTGRYAVIMKNGEEYTRLPLNIDTEVSVDGKNIVTIKDGKAYVSYGDCPDKLCMRQGEIDTEEKTIVCLPNRMSVRIEE